MESLRAQSVKACEECKVCLLEYIYLWFWKHYSVIWGYPGFYLHFPMNLGLGSNKNVFAVKKGEITSLSNSPVLLCRWHTRSTPSRQCWVCRWLSGDQEVHGPSSWHWTEGTPRQGSLGRIQFAWYNKHTISNKCVKGRTQFFFSHSSTMIKER